MTQEPRTTETINRDNAAIRDIMHRIRELTVPDRATVALGLVGHLATMMNRGQMAKLLGELQEEARRVQDVPPSRQRDDDRGGPGEGAAAKEAGKPRAAQAAAGRDDDREPRSASGRNPSGQRPTDRHSVGEPAADQRAAGQHGGVGQAGRGEFRSGSLL